MLDERDHDVDEVMTKARPPDSPAVVLARARVESALFGTPSGITRFHVLDRLGKGGMGVVYAAYDPDLDRGVALKMIHVPERGRELALAEAKALAKVSHPNVVPVFDVGVIEDQVYIVMELVRGKTLAAWVADQSVRAIVDAYRQAGAALAAVHAAGLVHRDFKPENAIVGVDGRVRVVDFGLAWEARARGRTGGTPRYMAPELGGGEVTPAADQFSFSVSLGEALGERAPRWIADIIARGRAADPADRFASMQEIVRALGRDPARAWRWRIGAGAIVVALGTAFFVGRSRSAEDTCAGGAAAIDAAWPRKARAAQLARLATFGAYGGEVAATIAPVLDAHAARWAAGHRDACLAHRRGESSPALLDRRMVCLDRARAALTAVAEVAGTAEPRTLPEVARAASALPDPRACGDLAALARDVAPPPAAAATRVAALRGDIERARVLLAAGRSVTARDVATAAATELAKIPYPPLHAEAELVVGQATLHSDPAVSTAALDRAIRDGFASGLDALAIEAWARRAWVIGNTGNPDGALAGFDVIEVLSRRAEHAAFARAILHNNAGTVEIVRGHRDAARRAFEEALRHARDVTGPGAAELAVIHRNLALVTPDNARRDAELLRAREALAALLGATHPDVLRMDHMRATTSIADLRTAEAMLARTCAQLARYESAVPGMASCYVELGDLRDRTGDRAGAIAALEQARTYPPRDVPQLEGMLADWRGDHAKAIAALEAALAVAPAAERDLFAKRYHRAKLELAYGRALQHAGRTRDARAAFERVIALMHDVDASFALAVQRRLADARAGLAATGSR